MPSKEPKKALSLCTSLGRRESLVLGGCFEHRTQDTDFVRVNILDIPASFVAIREADEEHDRLAAQHSAVVVEVPLGLEIIQFRLDRSIVVKRCEHTLVGAVVRCWVGGTFVALAVGAVRGNFTRKGFALLMA